jgi:hypothetical protein
MMIRGRQLAIAIVAAFFIPQTGLGAPTTDQTLAWIKAKLPRNLAPEPDRSGWTTTRDQELRSFHGCTATFVRTVHTFNSSSGSSQDYEFVTTIPFKNVSANSIYVEKSGSSWWVNFGAASGKPFEVRQKDTRRENQNAPQETKSTDSSDSHSLYLEHKALADRVVAALRHLSKLCDSENEPF